MKNLKLRGWVETLLIIESMFMLLICASECDDTFIFITSKIIALLIIYKNYIVIKKWGKIYE